MTAEPRPIEETERDAEDAAWKAERYDYLVGNDGNPEWQLERENIDFKERLSAAESRIESLVEEREALREALRQIIEDVRSTAGEIADRTVISTTAAAGRLLDVTDSLRSVLSSRETTDSPTCPTCGSDDPAKRLCTSCHPVGSGFDAFMHHEACTDTFHSTDRGKEDS